VRGNPTRDARLPEGALLRAAALVYGAAGAVSLVVLAVRDRGAVVGRLLGDRPLVGVAAGLAVGLAAVLVSRALVAAWRSARAAEDALAELIGPLSGRACLALAAASALGEELLFRGVLQPWLGLWIASILFGAVHVPPRRELRPWPVMAAVMGLALGVLFDGTGGILAPVLAHATVNAVNLRRLSAFARARNLAEPLARAAAPPGGER
jgi:hypothetical protein